MGLTKTTTTRPRGSLRRAPPGLVGDDGNVDDSEAALESYEIADDLHEELITSAVNPTRALTPKPPAP